MITIQIYSCVWKVPSFLLQVKGKLSPSFFLFVSVRAVKDILNLWQTRGRCVMFIKINSIKGQSVLCYQTWVLNMSSNHSVSDLTGLNR
jgi:hypothetical protein